MSEPPSEDQRVSAGTMHPDEIDINVALVERLVAAQFPKLGELTISVVRSTGTVNAIYRIGDRLSARMPRVLSWEADLEAELAWLPRLAPQLPLSIPEPVAKGRPASGYPCSWAIYRWIDGESYSDVIAAWSVFGPVGRRVFRSALDVDEGTYHRARDYALHQAALMIPYYTETNPGFVEHAKRTVDEVLADRATERE